MKLVCLQHVAFEGPAWIGRWAEKNGMELETVALFQGHPMPRSDEFDGLVVMGGPMSANDDQRFPWMPPEKEFIANAVQSAKPTLGICLGAQLIAASLGAGVYPNPKKEIGWFPVDKVPGADQSDLGALLPRRFTALHWHGDTFDLPRGAVHLARSQACKNQAFAYKETVLGLQFHLEATRDSTDALIENCRNELVTASMVQSETLIRTGCSALENTHALLEALLTQLYRKNP